MFGHLLPKLGGGGGRDTCNIEGVSGQARDHGGGGGGRGGVPPLEIGKKMLSEDFLSSFTYVLLMKLGGIDTLYMQNGRGWSDRRLSMVRGGGSEGLCPPPLKMKKRKANIGQLVRWGTNRRNIFVL